MQIFIKTLTGRKSNFNFEPDNTVRHVKEALQEREGIQVEQIRLIYSGKQMSDDCKLSDYNVKPGSTIHMYHPRHRASSAFYCPPSRMPTPTVQLSDYCQNRVSANRVNFAIGQPSEATVPTKILKDAIEGGCEAAMKDWCMYQYANTQGPLVFRQELAKMLSTCYGGAVRPDQLAVSSGISSSLSILAKGIVGGLGSLVLVEENTYFLAGKIFEEAGASLLPVPIDEEGIIPGRLEEVIQSCSSKVSALYTIPVHHNPRGTVMSISRQKALMDLAVKYDFLVRGLILVDAVDEGAMESSLNRRSEKLWVIGVRNFQRIVLRVDKPVISDEPYGLLYYDNPRDNDTGPSSEGIRSLMQVAGEKEEWMRHCVVCGSFSKELERPGDPHQILAPGLRLGWFHTHPDNIAKIMPSGVLLSGGGPPPVLVEAVTTLMKDGHLREHLVVDELRRIYASRLGAMVTSLKEEMSDFATFHEPSGDTSSG
ncbi:hypothetical protein FOZ60_007738 [Perkinsus olseni]|uniref:Ubiquitin-like domain-containing protein n=1 Tax=Perkinsus olseni TaxID=32597 RepID=A0A7J6NL16_PEROL|nr:hypothetical protein FOZ60_007738 [Perkinsus olseni]